MFFFLILMKTSLCYILDTFFPDVMKTSKFRHYNLTFVLKIYKLTYLNCILQMCGILVSTVFGYSALRLPSRQNVSTCRIFFVTESEVHTSKSGTWNYEYSLPGISLPRSHVIQRYHMKQYATTHTTYPCTSPHVTTCHHTPSHAITTTTSNNLSINQPCIPDRDAAPSRHEETSRVLRPSR